MERSLTVAKKIGMQDASRISIGQHDVHIACFVSYQNQALHIPPGFIRDATPKHLYAYRSQCRKDRG